jgi:putative methionine-R-sulfoxide reductase with GAF domain
MIQTDTVKTLALIAVQGVALLVLDIATPLGIAVWVMYLIPLGLTTWLPYRQAPFVAAAIFSAFLVAGFIFSPPGIAASIALLNHGFAVLTLWVIALMLSKLKQRTAMELQTEVHKRLEVEEQLRFSQQALAREREIKEGHARIKARRLQDRQLLQRSRDLEDMSRVSEAVLRALPGSGLMDHSLEAAIRATNAEAGSILLVDPRTQRLIFRSVVGRQAQFLMGKEVLPGTSIAHAVMASGHPEIIPDAKLDPRHNAGFDDQSGFATRNMLVAPLKLPGEDAIGVLEVVNKTTGHFSQEDLGVLATLSTLLTASVEQARLYREQVGREQQDVHAQSHPVT